MTATPRPPFDQWLLGQTDREDSVGDIAREFSEDRRVGCAGDIRTPEQLISHIERVHHPIDLAIRAVEQARAEYLRGRVDPPTWPYGAAVTLTSRNLVVALAITSAVLMLVDSYSS
jgi:hypothetical protein